MGDIKVKGDNKVTKWYKNTNIHEGPTNKQTNSQADRQPNTQLTHLRYVCIFDTFNEMTVMTSTSTSTTTSTNNNNFEMFIAVIYVCSGTVLLLTTTWNICCCLFYLCSYVTVWVKYVCESWNNRNPFLIILYVVGKSRRC